MHTRRLAHAYLVGALAHGSWITTAFGQGLPTTPVALSGQAAPGTGATYARFTAPSINPSGGMAFGAWLAGTGVTELTDSAMFTGSPATGFQLLAREGQSAPVATPGVVLGEFLLGGSPITPQEHAIVGSEIRGAQSGRAFFAGTPGDLRFVHQQSPSEAVLGQPVLNSGPQAVLWTQGQQRIVHWNGSVTTLVPTPNEIFQPTLNAAGRIAFTIFGSEGNPSGLYAGPPGAFQPVAARGGAAPGLPAGYTFDLPLDASQNNAGAFAFLSSAKSAAPDSYTWGLWAGQAGGLRLLAQDGQAAPGLPGYRIERLLWDIDSPTAPSLSGAGHVPFWGSIERDDGSDQGTASWLAAPDGSVRLLARQGDMVSVPGTSGEAEVGFIYDNGLWVNSAGQVVIRASVSTRDALLAALPDGQLRVIARAGSPFEVAPGDIRQVSDFFFGGPATGGEDGRIAHLNDVGQFVYRLDFTDGTSGLFMTTVPEPTAATLAVAGCATLLARRRRRGRAGPAPVDAEQ